MRSSNPVLGRAFNQRGYAAFDPSTINSDPAAMEDLYNAPAASSMRTGRMTIDDVVTRTGILFAVLLAVGAVPLQTKSRVGSSIQITTKKVSL